MAHPQIPAGWYPDPSGDETKQRYWDGTAWTDHVQDASPSTGLPRPSNTQWGQVYSPALTGVEDKSTMWIVIGCICFILCWPIAIGQVICAINAHSAFLAGDIVSYNSKLKTAKILLIVNVCVGLALWVCCIAFGWLALMGALFVK